MDVKVKICGITNIEDGHAAVNAGADAIGLMFAASSPRYLSIEDAAEISHSLSPWVMRVGVFVNPEPDIVHETISQCGLNMLQFHGDETPDFCSQFGIMSMKAFRIKDAESLIPLPSYKTDAFLLDSYVAGKQGGTGEKFNWQLAIEAKKFGKPIFLAGGLTAFNIAEAVRQVQPFAVDVSSGVESAPGKKDHQKIRQFIENVRNA